ncbi:hypothetical protein BDQ17DRAFT_1209236, partial [Cyathus striatus]
IHLQAMNIMNQAHCNELQFCLIAKQEKKESSKKGKLVADGLPWLLSSDEFYETVVEFTQWRGEQATEKTAMADRKEMWREEVRKWEAEKAKYTADSKADSKAHKNAVATW